MSNVWKALLVVVGVGVGAFVFYLGRDKESGRHAFRGQSLDAGPCAVPSGLARNGATATWNPLSSQGRCAPTATKLVVDNGLEQSIQITLGATALEVKAGDQLTIVTIPGRFDLHTSTADGAVLDEATLELAASHAYVYDPNLVYDYVVKTRSYGIALGSAEERPLVPAVVFDPGPVDCLFEPFPAKVRVEGHSQLEPGVVSATKTALVHVPSARLGPPVRHGDLRLVTVTPRHLVAISGHPSLGAGLAAVYIDNPDERAELPVTLDGVAVGAVPRGAYLRVDVLAGRHELAAPPASIEVKAGESWVFCPEGRREYKMEAVQYGMPVSGQKTPATHAPARGLQAFRVTADFVFEPPEQVRGFMGTAMTVLRRGRAGDFHASVAREVAALQAREGRTLDSRWGHPDPATANECDLLGARGLIAELKGAEARAQEAYAEATAWGCALPDGAHAAAPKP